MSDYCSYMWSVPDWRTDEMYILLDNREQGIYRNLLDECWSNGSIPADIELLANFVREPLDYFAEVWAKIRSKFQVVPRSKGQKLMSSRMEQDRTRLNNIRNRYRIRAEKGGQALAAKMRQKRELEASSLQQARLAEAQTQTQIQIYKEEESIKNIYTLAAAREVYGQFNNVWLTGPEYEKLKIRFNGQTQERIEALSEYMASKGKKYKSHYATILTWSRKNNRKPEYQQEKRLQPIAGSNQGPMQNLTKEELEHERQKFWEFRAASTNSKY